MSSFEASDAVKWLKSFGVVSPSQPSTEDGVEVLLFSQLKDGTALCNLINLLKPGTIQKVKDMKLYIVVYMKDMKRLLHF